MQGDKSVSGIMDKLSLKKKDLSKPVTIPIDADDKPANITMDKVKAEVDALNKRRAEFAVDANDNAAKAKLLAIDIRLDKLNKYMARPGVELQGLDSTLLGIYRINAALDKVNGKTATATVKVRTDQSSNFISRALRGGGGGGSGGGGAFSGPFQGIAGVGSGASAGAIEALTSPVGAGAAAVAAPFIGTGIAGGALGALGTGLAGLGIAGGLGAGQSNPRDAAAANNLLHAASLRVIADQAKLNALQTSGKATTSQLASAQAALASARAAQTAAQGKVADLGPPMSKQTIAAQAAFKNLATNAKKSLQTIGASFAPVMSTIFKTANTTLSALTPVFATAEKTISGPFQQVGTILATSMASPAVVTAVKGLATSFGEFLKGFAPQIPGIVNAIANGINGMASAFTDHPGLIKGMGSVLAFLLKIPGFVAGAMGSLTRVTAWLIGGLPHAVSIGLDAARGFFIDVGHQIETIWDSVWNTLKSATSTGAGFLSAFWTTITGPFRAGYNFVIGIFNGIKSFITTNFDAWWAKNGEAVIAVWSGVWIKIKEIATTIWNGIVLAAQGFIGALAIIFQTGKTIILGVWGAIWPLVKAIFQAAWTVITTVLQAGWVIIKTVFQIGASVVLAIWQTAWAVIKLVFEQAWAIIRTSVKIGWDIIVGIWTTALNLLTGRWGAAWDSIRNMFIQIWNAMRSFLQGTMTRMWNTIVSVWNTVIAFFRTIPGKILNAIGSLSTLLLNVGRNVIGGLFNGIKQALANVGGWIKSNLVDPIVNAVKGFFGIHSPSTVMAGIGGHLIGGLFRGILNADPTKFIGKIFGGLPEALGSIVGKGLVALSHLPAKAMKALGSLGSKIGGFFAKLFGGGGGGGVGQWMGVVLQALALNGLPASLANQVLRQISTESGGNPNAINLTDINAQHGDPSRGLLQTIGATFAAYHVAGTSNNIYDPLANVAAAINYAKHTYGPSLMSGGGGLGSGHGYAMGTGGAAAGWAMVGERGPEMVLFNGGETVVPNGGMTGYAKGTPSAEINAGISLYLKYIHGDLLTVAKLHSSQITFLKDISKYYSGSTARHLDDSVNKQTQAMIAAANQLTSLQKNFAAAQSYAGTVKSNAIGFGALSNVDLNSGLGIAGGLSNKLSKLKAFASMITQLKKRGVSAGVIQQIIDMGPDTGYAYAAALVGATAGTISSVNRTTSAINTAATSLGNTAAFTVYGVNIAKGLKSQEASLHALMRRLGKSLAHEAVTAFRVPKSKVPHFAGGTSHAPSGWAVVGENGPELINLRGGESIVPGGSLGGRSGGGTTIVNVNVRGALSTDREISKAVSDGLANLERHGGSVPWK
jgi:SLT domain-containing protein/phage-related protein